MAKFFHDRLSIEDGLARIRRFLSEIELNDARSFAQVQLTCSVGELNWRSDDIAASQIGRMDLGDYFEKIGDLRFLPFVSLEFKASHSNSRRGTLDFVSVVSIHQNDDSFCAELTVQHLAKLKEPLSALSKLRGVFGLADKGAVLSKSFPTEINAPIEAIGTTLSSLQQHSQELASRFAGQIARHDEWLLEEKTKLRDAAHARQAELEQQYQEREEKLSAAISKDREALAKEREAHQALVLEFETRESKFVRRDLLKTMRETIAERAGKMEISERTQDKRKTVHWLCVVALLFSAALVGFAMYQLVQKGEGANWTTYLPLSTGVLFFVSTIVFYIKWSDRWFRRHADAEFRYMKFNDDVLRASWLAEMLFEWDPEERHAPFPEELLSSFTYGLFRDEQSQGVEHPSEALTSMMKEATSIKVGKGALELIKPAKKATKS